MIRASISAVSLLALTAQGFAPPATTSAPSALSSHHDGFNDPWPNRSPYSSDVGTRRRASSPFSSSSVSPPRPSSYEYEYAPPTGGGASIPFMITNKMKKVLIEELRYTRREVNSMSADRAHSIINGRMSNPRPAPSRYNEEEGANGNAAALPPSAAAGESESADESRLYGDDSSYRQYDSSHRQYDSSFQRYDSSYRQQYHYQGSPPEETAADPLEDMVDPLVEMEEQFGDLTDRVMRDDRYGPSVFSDPVVDRIDPFGTGSTSGGRRRYYR